MNLRDFALSMINKNPNVANNPRAQELIDVIKSGDEVRGQQIAQNICDTYGVTKEDAISQAKGFFNLQ